MAKFIVVELGIESKLVIKQSIGDDIEKTLNPIHIVDNDEDLRDLLEDLADQYDIEIDDDDAEALERYVKIYEIRDDEIDVTDAYEGEIDDDHDDDDDEPTLTDF